MNKIFLLASLFITFTCEAQKQTTIDSVKMTVQKFFTAMKTNDSAMFVSCFADSAVLQTINKNTGKVKIDNDKFQDFASIIANAPKGSLDEKITFDIVKVDDDLAIAWTPYSFYFNGKLSHCGVNSFQLVRINKEWKIQYLIDTRRREGCK